MEPVPALRAGEERSVNSLARTVHMAWIVLSAVTAAMQMVVILPRVTVAVYQDGQVYTVTVCALRDNGDQIAHCLVTAKMGRHALQMMESVSVHQDTEAPPVREFVPLAFMDTGAARHVHSVYTAVAPATILLDYVTVYLDLLEPCVMKYVPVADLARTALEYAPAPIMEHAILSTDPVSVILGGLVVTALSHAHLLTGDQTASTHATAIMELTAVPTMESANVPQDGLAFTVRNDVPLDFMGRTVH